MTVKPTFTATVSKSGKLQIDEPERFWAYCKTKFAGQRVVLTVDKPSRPKTSEQNRYFHGVVVPFVAEQAGYKPDSRKELEQVREALKADFGPLEQVISLKDKAYKWVPKSIARYTLEDYKLLIDNIDLWVYDTFGCRLPEPQSVI